MRSYVMFTALLLLCAARAADEPRTVLPGSVPAIPFPGHLTAQLAHSHNPDANIAVLELTLPPKTFGAPPHVHSREDEFFYVLEGTVHFLEREETVAAPAGTLMVLPRGHLHGFWNPTAEPARMLLMISPGEFAGFFDEVVARIKKENPDSPQKVGALLIEAAAKHDVQIHMDKVPEEARAFMK